MSGDTEQPGARTRSARILHLDDVEALAGPEIPAWRPVRAALGSQAFGTNAYTARAAGDDVVVEPHDEPARHEERYFVARGLARFTIDGETFDAPAGTSVFLPDPATHRHAVAEEAGTTVLSLAGRRDSVRRRGNGDSVPRRSPGGIRRAPGRSSRTGSPSIRATRGFGGRWRRCRARARTPEAGRRTAH